MHCDALEQPLKSETDPLTTNDDEFAKRDIIKSSKDLPRSKHDVSRSNVSRKDVGLRQENNNLDRNIGEIIKVDLTTYDHHPNQYFRGWTKAGRPKGPQADDTVFT